MNVTDYVKYVQSSLSYECSHWMLVYVPIMPAYITIIKIVGCRPTYLTEQFTYLPSSKANLSSSSKAAGPGTRNRPSIFSPRILPNTVVHIDHTNTLPTYLAALLLQHNSPLSEGSHNLWPKHAHTHTHPSHTHRACTHIPHTSPTHRARTHIPHTHHPHTHTPCTHTCHTHTPHRYTHTIPQTQIHITKHTHTYTHSTSEDSSITALHNKILNSPLHS